MMEINEPFQEDKDDEGDSCNEDSVSEILANALYSISNGIGSFFVLVGVGILVVCFFYGCSLLNP